MFNNGVYLIDNGLLTWFDADENIDENIEPFFLTSNKCSMFLVGRNNEILIYIFDESCIDISDLDEIYSIVIYPNPLMFNNEVFTGSIPEKGVVAEILDSYGRKVISDNVNDGSLSLHGLSAGLYLVNFILKGNHILIK